MATTISTSTITFTDGSTWAGANGNLTPDDNTSRTSQGYNIGHIILANCVFTGNANGFTPGGIGFWALNSVNSYFNISVGIVSGIPAVNTTVFFPVNHPTQGSQSYFAVGGPSGLLTGSWKARGQACGAGINQTVGYFVLMERVA